MSHKHDHKITTRLKRAEGHMRSVISMIEDGRDCIDIVQQLHAVEAAIANAKKEIIQHHIQHCLEAQTQGAAPNNIKLLEDIKALAKYL